MTRLQERHRRQHVESLWLKRPVELTHKRTGSHPAFMSDAEFAALPDWKDVQYNNAYNTAYRPSPLSSMSPPSSITD